MNTHSNQQIVCDKYGSDFYESPPFFKVGISKNINETSGPINGLRHPIEGDTTGWYIWAGEYSNDANFFVPMHVEHLKEVCPIVLKYLGLAPGWRFLIDGDYEDVWYDESLLSVE